VKRRVELFRKRSTRDFGTLPDRETLVSEVSVIDSSDWPLDRNRRENLSEGQSEIQY